MLFPVNMCFAVGMRTSGVVLGIALPFVADALAKDVLDTAVDPSAVAHQKFDLERRGFDQAQVRAYLIAVGDALRDAQAREAEIRTRLGKAIRRAEKAEASLRDVPQDDPSALTRQVGDEVTAVLDAARVAGEQKVAAAEKSADQLLTGAKSEATKIRRAAETVLDERRAEADAMATKLLDERQAEADKIVATARTDADTLRQDAAADIARVRDECDGLIREAEEARAQILQDMERRRRQARAQIERLRVGRDRLLRSYEVVRRTLDESTVELKTSLKEAKVMGDTAARKVAAEPLREPAQIEAELADAKLLRTDASPKRSLPKPAVADVTPPAAEAALPHVDLRPGAFTDASAPTPKRPVVRDTAVPKPPAVAPTIKAPEVAETPDAETADAEATDAVAATPLALDTPSVEAPAETDDTSAEADPVMRTAGERDADDGTDEHEADGPALGVDVDDVSDSDDFSDLPKAELAIIDASDEIEEVIALGPEPDVSDVVSWVPADTGDEPSASDASAMVDDEPAPEPAEAAPSAGGLFAALRAQAGADDADDVQEPTVAAAADSAEVDAEELDAEQLDTAGVDDTAQGDETPAVEDLDIEAEPSPADAAVELLRQRDAVVAEVAIDLEKRLKRALADEQNDVLAGIRAAGKHAVELIGLVGETDDHVQRYVVAINAVAANAYAAGALLVDGESNESTMPAGAVEELIGSAVVLPLRLRLIELDSISVDHASVHVDAVRAFYRQRKTDHLAEAATSLASLLVTAGACDVLPENTPVPWLAVV